MASIHLYFAGKQVGDTQKRGKPEMRSFCRKSLDLHWSASARPGRGPASVPHLRYLSVNRHFNEWTPFNSALHLFSFLRKKNNCFGENNGVDWFEVAVWFVVTFKRLAAREGLWLRHGLHLGRIAERLHVLLRGSKGAGSLRTTGNNPDWVVIIIPCSKLTSLRQKILKCFQVRGRSNVMVFLQQRLLFLIIRFCNWWGQK